MIRHVLLVPNAFKQCMTAAEAATAMAKGVRSANAKLDNVTLSSKEFPFADGGDGSLDVLLAHRWGECRTAIVEDAFGQEISARWLFRPSSHEAYIEMSEAAGLRRLTGSINPAFATTRGVGQLIEAALNEGARTLTIGLGGSATIDGGAGALQALGAKFLDSSSQPFVPFPKHLTELHAVDFSSLDKRLYKTTFQIWADVSTSIAECVRVFGPQKGVAPVDIDTYSNGLKRLCLALGFQSNWRSPWFGAAGGFAAAFAWLNHVVIRPGAEAMTDFLDLEPAIIASDCVLTGEGQFDATSLQGKAPGHVFECAQKHGKSFAVFSGLINTMGIPSATDVVSLSNGDEDIDVAIQEAPLRLESAVSKWLMNRYKRFR